MCFFSACPWSYVYLPLWSLWLWIIMIVDIFILKIMDDGGHGDFFPRWSMEILAFTELPALVFCSTKKLFKSVCSFCSVDIILPQDPVSCTASCSYVQFKTWQLHLLTVDICRWRMMIWIKLPKATLSAICRQQYPGKWEIQLQRSSCPLENWGEIELCVCICFALLVPF